MTDIVAVCRVITQNASRLQEIGEELRREANGVEWTYQITADHFIAQSCCLADDIGHYGTFAARAATNVMRVHETVGA